MQNTKRVAIVLGYGVRVDEMYRRHLDIVAGSADRFDRIILSGGLTCKDKPFVSEADTMAAYLMYNVPAYNLPELVFEDRALTTYDNIANSRIILEQMPREKGIKLEITVFAKKPWWLKARVLSWMLLRLPNTSVRVVGTAPGTSWKEYAKQIFAGTPAAVLSALVPSIQKLKPSVRRLKQK